MLRPEYRARKDKKESEDDKNQNNHYNNFMKQIKQSKNHRNGVWDKKNLKIIVYFCLLVLVFNFSLARAEETTVSEDLSTGSSQEAAAVPESGQVTIIEPEPQTQLILENPVEPAPSLEAVVPADLSNISPTEDLTPLISTSSEPIIFDLSQLAATGTAATTGDILENTVAGASESAGGGEPILHEVLTGIIRDANIKGLTILAQWQMSNEKNEGKYLGLDESALSGAQFLPSGQFAISKPVAVCALVADVGGLADINNISATINYPLAMAKAINQAGEKSGCGGLKAELNLEKMNYEDAATLVCDQLRNNNNNLLAWGSDKIDNLIYSYEQVCGQDGLLAKQAAELYCAEALLSYDDPAGDYPVKVSAQNNNGAAVTGENYLKYLELTTFENDFSEILYGPVKLNELKVLEGDLNWGESTGPTVRNTGNTRLQIKILQNDFGLGKTGDEWNLAYQAKVGAAMDFINYLPEQTTVLNGLLELGRSDGLDFAVLIKKFPEANSDSAFWGKMILAADKVAPLGCQ